MGDSLPYVDLGNGFRATAVGLGYLHSCVVGNVNEVLDNAKFGVVKCFGEVSLCLIHQAQLSFPLP